VSNNEANPSEPASLEEMIPPIGSISLSPADHADAEAFAALRILAMRESLERIGRFDPQRARERFLSGFVPEFTRHILVDGLRAGLVVVKPDDEGLVLDHLYVDPHYQGRGVGAAVLAEVFAEADRQRKPLRVTALRGSDSNRFYVRHGFTLVREAEWDNYYLRPAIG
jgi:GNAT superfamily N-acetyltransferase